MRKWFRSHRPPPDCVGCGHSQADHYPGCLNIGPAPDFTHCKCQQFWGSDFPMSSLIPPVEERAKQLLAWSTSCVGRTEAVAQAIEAVLSEHKPVWAESIDMLCRCDCGHGHDIAGYEHDEHNAHIATEIVAALELREETRTLTDGWIQPSRNAFYYAQGLAPPRAVITREHRFVTPWGPLGEETPQ